MSTKSGPYEVDCGEDGIWSYQHDMVGDHTSVEAFYIWGPLDDSGWPSIYLEVARQFSKKRRGRRHDRLITDPRLAGLPGKLLNEIDLWPDTAGQGYDGWGPRLPEEE